LAGKRQRSECAGGRWTGSLRQVWRGVKFKEQPWQKEAWQCEKQAGDEANSYASEVKGSQ